MVFFCRIWKRPVTKGVLGKNRLKRWRYGYPDHLFWAIFIQNAHSHFGKQKTCVRAVFAAAGLSDSIVMIPSNLDFNINTAGQFQFH